MNHLPIVLPGIILFLILAYMVSREREPGVEWPESAGYERVAEYQSPNGDRVTILKPPKWRKNPYGGR